VNHSSVVPVVPVMTVGSHSVVLSIEADLKAMFGNDIFI
jgi:hypothetical protein